MRFQVSHSGSTTECREVLNAELAKLGPPIGPDQQVVRAAAAYVVESKIDPLHDEWDKKCNKLRGAGVEKDGLPPEPTCSFSIDIAIATS